MRVHLYDQDETTQIELSRREIEVLDRLLCDSDLSLVKERTLHVKLRIAEGEILARQLRRSAGRQPSGRKE